jgi:hypothetical protein
MRFQFSRISLKINACDQRANISTPPFIFGHALAISLGVATSSQKNRNPRDLKKVPRKRRSP